MGGASTHVAGEKISPDFDCIFGVVIYGVVINAELNGRIRELV